MISAGPPGLDLVVVDGQLLVAAQFTTRDIGNDLFMRRAKAVLAIMAIMHAQQQRAVLIPAARFLPKFGRLHSGHQQLECAGTIHLLAYDSLDLAENAQAQRHPGEQARGQTPDQAGPEHEFVADDFCFRRHFLERCQRKFR